MGYVTRRIALCLAVLTLFATAGCTEPLSSSAARSSGSAVATSSVRIGVLPTEDALPLWSAAGNDHFSEQGIPKVQLVEFQTAKERDAAFASGTVDAYVGDVIAAANLTAAGKANTIKTIMLGTDQSQGRFGIVMPPKKGPADGKRALLALADVPVAVTPESLEEYVFDGLMTEAGVATSSIKAVKGQKPAERYQQLMAGKIKAAVLPEPYLSLAEQSGANVVAVDTSAKANLSQSILAFSNSFLTAPGGTAAAAGVLAASDAGAADVNADLIAARPLTIEVAKLPKALELTYKVNTYPMHQLPLETDVAPVLSWMSAKGYLKTDVAFTQIVVPDATTEAQ